MVNYKNGKIYKIESKQGNCQYIGSTCQKLKARFKGHLNNYKHCEKSKRYITSFDVLKYPDATISLIKLYPCDDKKELFREEGKYIKQLDCVNKTQAGRTHREFYIENKQQILEDRKKFYIENKEKIMNNVSNYYQKNKQTRITYAKKYREENKQKLKEKASSRIICKCGMDIRFGDKRRHERTKYHLNHI